MARLCERPGCSRVAEFLYAIDAEHLTVWLEPFESGGSDRAGVLCGRHADAMVVPLGWMLDDRREEMPRLFRTSGMPAANPVERPRRARQGGGTASVEAMQLSLEAADDPVDDDDPPIDVEPDVADLDDLDKVADLDEVADERDEDWPGVSDAAVASDAGDGQDMVSPDDDGDESPLDDPTTVLPWRPVFDQTDDLGGLLTAHSPLLRRAFRSEPPPA